MRPSSSQSFTSLDILSSFTIGGNYPAFLVGSRVSHFSGVRTAKPEAAQFRSCFLNVLSLMPISWLFPVLPVSNRWIYYTTRVITPEIPYTFLKNMFRCPYLIHLRLLSSAALTWKLFMHWNYSCSSRKDNQNWCRIWFMYYIIRVSLSPVHFYHVGFVKVTNVLLLVFTWTGLIPPKFLKYLILLTAR